MLHVVILAAAAVMVVIVVVVVVCHLARDGGHEVRGVHAGRGVGEGRGHIVQVSSAQLGDDTVASCSAYVDGCEGGDGLQGGGDLVAPVGGLVG